MPSQHPGRERAVALGNRRERGHSSGRRSLVGHDSVGAAGPSSKAGGPRPRPLGSAELHGDQGAERPGPRPWVFSGTPLVAGARRSAPGRLGRRLADPLRPYALLIALAATPRPGTRRYARAALQAARPAGVRTRTVPHTGVLGEISLDLRGEGVYTSPSASGQRAGGRIALPERSGLHLDN